MADEDHPLLLSAAQIGTEQDCSFMLELKAIERGVLAAVLQHSGVDMRQVPQDRLHYMARLIEADRRRAAGRDAKRPRSD